MNTARRGFTLIEMLVTVSLIAIFMTGVVLSVQKINNMTDSYSQVVAADQLLTIKQGIEVYRRLFGRVPSNIEEVSSRMVLVGSPEGKYGSHYEISKNDGLAEGIIIWADGAKENLSSILAKIGYKNNGQHQ